MIGIHQREGGSTGSQPSWKWDKEYESGVLVNVILTKTRDLQVAHGNVVLSLFLTLTLSLSLTHTQRHSNCLPATRFQ